MLGESNKVNLLIMSDEDISIYICVTYNRNVKIHMDHLYNKASNNILAKPNPVTLLISVLSSR